MTEQTNETTAQQEETTPAAEEKKFSQTEVDELISKRLARERKKYPTEQEIADYQSWKATQQPKEADAGQDEYKVKYEQTARELQQLKNERYLLSKGVPVDDVDYYAYKIGRLTGNDTTFEQAAQQYLEEKHIGGMKVSTGVQMTGTAAKTENEAINDAFRKMAGRK